MLLTDREIEAARGAAVSGIGGDREMNERDMRPNKLLLWLLLLLIVPGYQNKAAADRRAEKCWAQEEKERQEEQASIDGQRKDVEVLEALKSFDAFWDFVISPKTDYVDRQAAAFEFAERSPRPFPIGRVLPKLMEARAALQEESWRSNWGLDRSPLSQMDLHYQAPQVFVLNGYEWHPPAAVGKYPCSLREKREAPWPWQVSVAIDGLLVKLREKAYPRKRVNREWLEALMAMPCESDRQAEGIVEAAPPAISADPVRVLGVLRNIALNPKFGYGGRDIGWYVGSFLYSDVAAAEKDRYLLDPKLAHTLIYDILENSPSAPARDSAGRHISRRFLRPGERVSPFPATEILLLSKKALHGNGEPNISALTYASMVYGLVDNPPERISEDPQRAAMAIEIHHNQAEVEKKLVGFKQWFELNSKELAARAATESAEINRIKDALSRVKKCSLSENSSERINAEQQDQ